MTGQLSNSICIGANAGPLNMPAGAIFIDASNSGVTPLTSGFFAAPLNAGLAPGGSNPVYYDPATFELFQNTSSKIYKTDVVDLDLTSASNNLYNLNPRSYKYLKSMEAGDCIGYIAEEVQAIDPRLSVNDRTGAAMNVDWNNIVLYLVAALKKQKTQINDLTTRIELLERKS